MRSADFAPLDSEALVDLLHAHGVNMRYLGELSEVHLECYSKQSISAFLYVNIAIYCSYQYDEQIYIQQGKGF